MHQWDKNIEREIELLKILFDGLYSWSCERFPENDRKAKKLLRKIIVLWWDYFTGEKVCEF